MLIRCSALLCIGFFIVGILSFFLFSLSLPPFFFFFFPSLPLGFPRPAGRTSVGRLNKPYFIATVIAFVEYSTAARLQATSRRFSIMCVSGWRGGRAGRGARLGSPIKAGFCISFLFSFFPAATLSGVREVWRTLDGLKRSAFFFFFSSKSYEETLPPPPPFVHNRFGAATLLCLPSVHSALFFRR